MSRKSSDRETQSSFEDELLTLRKQIYQALTHPFSEAQAHVLLFRNKEIPQGPHLVQKKDFHSWEELEALCREVDSAINSYITRSHKPLFVLSHLFRSGQIPRKVEAERALRQLEEQGIGAHELAHARRAIQLGADIAKMRLQFVALADGKRDDLKCSMQIDLGTEDYRILAFSALAPRVPSPMDLESVRIVLNNQQDYPLSPAELELLKTEYAKKVKK